MNLHPQHSDDPVLAWIESEWLIKTEEKDQKSRAKLLRLLVNHVKTVEGIPLLFQEDIRNKVNVLLNELGTMEIDEAAQCVSSIDHAKKRLDSTSDFGAGLRAQLGSAEKREIRRTYKSLKLGPKNPESA
jgi:hypothetical protein